MIQEQIKLEEKMSARGVERYYASTTEAESAERGSNTTYAARLIPEYFLPLVQEIQEWLTSKSRGYMAKYKVLVQGVAPEQAAFFTLRCLFDSLMAERRIQSLAGSIGKRIEDEQRFSVFAEQMPDYVKYVKDYWESVHTVSYDHKANSMVALMRRYDIKWNSWTQLERIHVGLALIRCLSNCSNIISVKTEYVNKKKQVVVRPTPECLEWIFHHTERMSTLHPDLLPCVITPDEWTSLASGGYYTPQVRDRTPLVKTRHKAHRDVINTADIRSVMECANSLQETSWRVNRMVLSVAQEVWRRNMGIGMPLTEPFKPSPCPVQTHDKTLMTDEEKDILREWKAEAAAMYSAERERVGKCLQTSRILRTSVEMSAYSEMFYTIQCDFRGRMYCTCNGMSPQGPDLGKALVEFQDGKHICTDDAEAWFLIHGANTYGFDKLPFRDRVSAILGMEKEIVQVAADPMRTTSIWGNADSPYRFLAWCAEFAQLQKRGSAFLNHVPITVDGTCNGLQHFSALLRDEIGGAATNLTQQYAPSDIYTTVADKVIQKLQTHPDPIAKQWLHYKVTRDITKKPVMTLPYGSTLQNCIHSIYHSIISSDKSIFSESQFKASLFLAPIVWEAIGETVVAARDAMGWLKAVARELCKHRLPMQWTAPSGFPVYHAMYKVDVARIRTCIDTEYSLSIGTFTDELAMHKQVNGASPNFVHSLDASHLVKTVNASKAAGVTHFSCVHDSFGTHASDTAVLVQTLKEQFVQMYEQNNPLQQLLENVPDYCNIPDIPEYGNLNIQDVLKSDYFFS